MLPDRLAPRHRRPLREQAAEQLAAAGVDAEVAHRPHRSPGRTRSSAPPPTSLPASALEAARTSPWPSSRRLADDVVPVRAELVPTTALVDGLRVVKDDGEIARIEAAAAIATDALDRVRAPPARAARPRPSSASSSTPRCAASAPAARASRRSWRRARTAPSPTTGRPTARIVEGDLVVLDFGAKVDGYCSDMTRTVCVGEPTAEQQRMLDVVTEAQAAGVAAVRAGADVPGRRRRLPGGHRRRRVGATPSPTAPATASGSRSTRPPGSPRRRTEAATLAARSVVTVEPGVYLPGTVASASRTRVVVTDDGCRSLTHAPKDPAWPSPPTT